MKKSSKRILLCFAGIIILLVAGTAIATFLIDINQYKPDLEQTLTESTGIDWSIKGDIGLSLLPNISVTIDDIHAESNSKQILEAGQVTITAQLLPLLAKELRIGKFVIRDALLNIVKDDNGNLNFPISSQPQKTGPKTDTELPIKSLFIKQTAIKNGTIAYSDEQTETKTELSHFNFSFGSLSIIENHKLIDDLQNDIKNSKLDGTFRAERFTASKVELSNIVMKIEGNNGLFTIRPITAEIENAPLNSELTVDTTSTPHKITLECRVKGYEIGQMLKEPDKEEPISGFLDINARLDTKGQIQEELLDNLNGSFSIRGADLVLKQIDIDAVLDKYEKSREFSLVDLGGFFVLGPFGPLLTKSYDYSNVVFEMGGGQGTITKIVADWQIEGGVATAEDVAFATKENRVAVQGKINLAKSRFDQLEVAIINATGCKEFSQTINGTFDNPQTEEASFVVKTIINPITGLLKKATDVLKKEKCKPFYTGVVAHPSTE